MDTHRGNPMEPKDLYIYLYGGSNPVNRRDPNGLMPIEVEDACKGDYTEAIKYLRQKSPAASDLLNAIETDEYDYHVTRTGSSRADLDDPDRADRETRTVHWAPRKALKLDSGQVISPALLLAHELCHLYIIWDKGVLDRYEGDIKVIEFENTSAKELGEGLRKSHLDPGMDGGHFDVGGPTVRGPVPPVSYFRNLTQSFLNRALPGQLLPRLSTPGYDIPSTNQ
jgi:hypothetical protein